MNDVSLSVARDDRSDLGKRFGSASFRWVRELHTLGPKGTNCELAALDWLRRNDSGAALRLHPTFEDAAVAVRAAGDVAFLGVAAYPDLHRLIYANLHYFQILDVFIIDTDEMVLASRTGEMPAICATHQSPEKLLPADMQRRYVSSNAVAARECADGAVEGCLTTLRAARHHALKPIRSFGRVPMAFTIHGPPNTHRAAAAVGMDPAPATCARHLSTF